MRCAAFLFASLPDFGTYDADVGDVVAPTVSYAVVAPTAVSNVVAPTVSNVVAPTASNGRTTSKRVYNKDDNDDDNNVHQHNTVKKTKKTVDEDNEKGECDNNDRVLDESDSCSDEESLHAWVSKELRQKHTSPVAHADDDNVVDHDFWESNDKDYFPIINRNGKMIGMKYCL